MAQHTQELALEHTVLVVLDSADEALRSPALEALTIGRTLGHVTAFTLTAPSEEALDQLAEHGIDRVLLADVGDATPQIPAVAAAAVRAAVEQVEAGVVLLTSSFVNKEIAAHAAWLLHAGLIIDAAGVQRRDGQIVGSKRVFAATWDTECAVRADVAVLTLRANAIPPAPAPHRSEPVVQGLVVPVAAPRAELVDRMVHEAAADSAGVRRPALAEAAIVVAGGRGTEGDFTPIEDLADALGAAIGSTRDAVDEGWIGHDSQVGQTGVTVAPRLYIGAGISGAPHHRGGMQAAQTIIAVNYDAEAPLAEIADVVVVGDLHEVLPAAAAAIRAHRDGQ